MQILDHFFKIANSNVIIFNNLNKILKLIDMQNYNNNSTIKILKTTLLIFEMRKIN
jgi:hypothetical protein